MSAQWISVLAALAALTCLLLVWDKSATGSVGIYGLQAALVGLVALGAAWGRDPVAIAVALVALGSKAIALPVLLYVSPRKLGATPDTEPLLHTPASLLVALGLFVFGRGLAVGPAAMRSIEGLAIGMALVGLWLVASRRTALSQIIGLLVAESGASLLLSATGELRALTEMLLLLEALAAPSALLVLALWLKRRTGTSDTASLTALAELPGAEERP